MRMNTTITTGCAICDFYYNGECFYDKVCIGQVKTRTYTTSGTGSWSQFYPPSHVQLPQNNHLDYNYCPYCGKKLK